MNCKNCKKNICKEYRGKRWIGFDGKEYCENKFKKFKNKDPLKETIKLIEKSI